jgi:hypothetical protein
VQAASVEQVLGESARLRRVAAVERRVGELLHVVELVLRVELAQLLEALRVAAELLALEQHLCQREPRLDRALRVGEVLREHGLGPGRVLGARVDAQQGRALGLALLGRGVSSSFSSRIARSASRPSRAAASSALPSASRRRASAPAESQICS